MCGIRKKNFSSHSYSSEFILWLANGLELRRLGSGHRRFFQHPHHPTLLENLAASQVASSEWLDGG